MENALNSIFQTINMEIPEEVLELAFPCGDVYAPGTTIEKRIHEMVIKTYVLSKLQQYGKAVKIPLDDAWREDTSSHEYAELGALTGTLFRVPAEARYMRDITSVRGFSRSGAWINGPMTHPHAGGAPGNSMLDMMGAVTDSHSLRGAGGYPTPVLVGGNIIQVSPAISVAGLYLDCMIGLDGDLSTVPSNTVEPLCRYVLATIKGAIYKKLYIKLGTAQAIGGVPINEIRQVIERYESEGSEATKAELLKGVSAGLQIADPVSFREFISAAL